MTEPTQPEEHSEVTPSRRARLRPLELVGFAGVLAVFAGVVILLVLRDKAGVPEFGMAGIVAGIVFIVVVLVVALLGLGGKPSAEDVEARKDLQDPSKGDWH
ncbi:MAG: ABC transporter ATP-binding protein [Actinobacteria bacterium]|nr:ABC transporter ATP-binding protein [Actinomycetota bacterium]